MKFPSMQISAIAVASLSAAFAVAAVSAGGDKSRAETRPDEVAAMNQMVRADVNKDGAVTRDELERMDLELARRFDAADADHDGKLTLREFETLRSLNVFGTGGAAVSGSASSGRTGTHR